MRKGFAVLALMGIVVLGFCGDDDSDETDAGGDTTSATDQGDTDDGTAPTRRPSRKRPLGRATRTQSAPNS
jgi:hypothetical protein